MPARETVTIPTDFVVVVLQAVTVVTVTVALLAVSRLRRVDRRERFGRITSERGTPSITLISNRRPRLTSDSASPPLVGVSSGSSGRRCGTDGPPLLGQPSLLWAFALVDLWPHGPLNRNRLHDSILSASARTHTPTRHMANVVNDGRKRTVARAMVAAHRPCNNMDRSASPEHRACSTQPLPETPTLDSA